VDDPAGDCEQAKPESFRFPPPCWFVGVEGEGLHPGEQVSSERDDFEPEPVLGVVVEGQVPQPGVLQRPDPVFAAGALTVADLQ